MAKRETRESDPGVAQRQLYVEFELELAAANSCPLDELGSDFRGARQQIVDGECHNDITTSPDSCDCSDGGSGTQVVHAVNEVDSTCVCPVFKGFGCIPKVTELTDDGLRIETYLSDREHLSGLVDALESASNGVYLRRLKRVSSRSGGNQSDTAILRLRDVTEKQRETAIKAVSIGYYASPREASLSELAAELEISKSACSQRLNAVESKLAVSAFAERTSEG